MIRLAPTARQSSTLCWANSRARSTYPISAAGPPQHHCSRISPNSTPAAWRILAAARGTEVRWKAPSQSQKRIVSPPIGMSSPAAQSRTLLLGDRHLAEHRLGLLSRSVGSTHRCHCGWWMPYSTASARIALTSCTVRVRNR